MSFILRCKESSSWLFILLKRTFISLFIQNLKRTLKLSLIFRTFSIIRSNTRWFPIRWQSWKHIISSYLALNTDRSSSNCSKTIIWKIRSNRSHESLSTILHWRLIQINDIFHLSTHRFLLSSSSISLKHLIFWFIHWQVSSSNQIYG